MYKIQTNKVVKAIVPDALGKATLFGLLKNEAYLAYKKIQSENVWLVIAKKEISNCYFRLDVLEINGVVAATIVSSMLLNGVYHMVGMYVMPEYRSRNIDNTLPGFTKLPEIKNNNYSISSYLLSNYLEDIVSKQGCQVTLEVKNGNNYAWLLYEKKLLPSKDNKNIGFTLLSRRQIENYAYHRGKIIESLKKLDTPSDDIKYLVRWKGSPDFDDQTLRWSYNRIYTLHIPDEKSRLDFRRESRVIFRLKILLKILLNGQIVKFFKFKLIKTSELFK